MGRYDRIQVYDGSAWRKPSEIQVYNGTRYVSLGSDSSYNTEHIYANNGGDNYPRATLYRHDYTIPGESYSYGTFSLGDDQLCWNPYKSGDHYIKCTIKKTTNGAVNILTSKTSNDSSHLIVTWEADGRIKVSIKSEYGKSPGTNNLYSSNAVGANQWVTLEIIAYKSSTDGYGKLTIKFNGTSVQRDYNHTFSRNGMSNNWGDSNLQFRGTLQVQLAHYTTTKAVTSKWVVNMTSNPIKATEGKITKNNTKITNTSTTGTEWL